MTATLAVFSLFVARSAHAQEAVALNSQAVVLHYNQNGSASAHPNSSQPTWISHQDCQNNVYLAVPLTLSGTLNVPIETWAGPSGADCTDSTQRTGTTQVCWQVAASAQPAQSMTININSQDIVGPYTLPTGQKQPAGFTPHTGAGDPSVCNSFTTSGANPVTLFFMPFANSTSSGTDATYGISLAMIGPAAPTSVGVGVGEKLLKISWTPQNDVNTQGFAIYCDPPPGKEGTVTADGGIGATIDSGTVLVCADGGTEDGGFDDAGNPIVSEVDAGCHLENQASSPTDGTSGNCSSSEVFSGGGTTTSTGDDESGTTTQVTGLTPAPNNIADYKCGDVGGATATSFTLSGLQDGTKYVVGVAAYDTVGNIGPMSIPGCDSPTPVTDFFDTYKNAGGGAGGGFCSVDQNSEPAGLSAFVLVGGAAAISVVRRRRQNKRSARR